MAKKICSCSNFLSCFSCFSAANNHHASPSSTTPNAASHRVDTQTALSSSSDKEGTSSSGISAAVMKHDSLQLPESESVGGSSSPSKVPSPPPSIPSEPATVGTIPTEVPKNEKVGEGCSSSSRNDDVTLQTAPDFISQIVTSSSGISAAVKRHDSQLPESASVGGSSSSSKVPSPPLCRQIEPARGGAVPAKVPKDDLQPDPASKQSFSEADASGNEKDGEGRGSSSSRNADLDTVQDLSRQIVKDVDAVDGERVDLDGLMKHISQLLDIIEGKTSSPQRQRLAEDYFSTTSKIFTKLKKFLSQAKDVIPAEPIKTAVNVVLEGMGAADLITTPFVVVAYILDKVEEVGDNKNECITLLGQMYSLAKLVKDFQERSQLMGTNGIIDLVKKAIELIVEGSILCCTQMQSSTFSKLWGASVNKEDLSKFRQKLTAMYTDMNAQMNLRILDNLTYKKPTLSREYPEHAVGMEEPVKEVLQLLDWKSEEKAVAVMLHGFGGMGKTTLGDAVFSKANFEGCKYSKVRLFQDIKSQPDIIQLQKSISEDLMEPEEKFPKITMYEDGQRELGKILAKVPAFLYIDNVLGEKELEQLLPKDVNKSKKLRLLFTARDQDVGTAFQGKTFYKIYDMKTISNSTAMSFFDDMKERLNSSQINDLINICGGVPLMLTLVAKVLSSGEDKQKAYYKVMQDKQNVNALTYRGAKEEYFFAYDCLPDECKDPFLDVCFFFKGWDWDTVADIVGEDQLDILEKRALVTKDDSAASVHDIILTIGHEKAKGTRFKFTNASQFHEFLYQDEEKNIKGIWFSENKDPCTISASKLESMCKSLRVVDIGNFTKVEGQCHKIFENLIYFQGGITRLPFDVSKINKLRYLKYEPQDLTLPKMPSSLRHMEFDGRLESPSSEISSICLQQLGNLRILRLVRFAELKNLPERIGDQLKVLQELSLSHCKSLKKLPASISSLQSLRLLRMDYCSSLGQLAKDFGSLKSLQELNLQRCLNLRQLGEDFGSLNSLQELNLEGCAGLTTLPSNFEKLSSLKSLKLSYCENLEDLPRGLGNLSSLVALNFRNCLKLRSIPDSIGQLKLTASCMRMCSSLTELPDGFCNLSFITNLELQRCTSLHKLPTRFGELASLRRLLLNRCRSLERLPESFGQLRCLETLAMPFCASLEALCNDFHCLTSLQFLNLTSCERLKKLPEDFDCLPSLQHLILRSCTMLEGKSMDSVLKIKTLDIVEIEGSGMLVDRWAEIQRESDQSSSFQEKVVTGRAIYRENIERKILSQLEFLFSEGREKPLFHPSAPLLFVVFDDLINFNNNFPWPLIEETIDDIQINFEMLYIGRHFDKLPSKAKNIIVGHVDDLKQEVVNLKRTMEILLGVLAGVQSFIQMTMVEDGGGGKCRPCWKRLTEREMEEFLLCSCRKYLQLKQLAETSQESSTKLLRELFAAGEAQSCTFMKAASGSSKPLSCTAEDLKGKTILLEIRPLHVGYDLRLASLIQLYNTKKETSNLEIISIPLVHRSSSSRIDIFEQFSSEIPWLVIQNPWAIPSAVKYFLMNLFARHERESDSPTDIKIIESNGRIFTTSKPVMGLLDSWGTKAYPFTLQKIEELKKEEWNQMETMPTLEFLFNGLESVSHQVKKMVLQRKVVCLYGGSESENTMKEFTGLMRNAFISLKDNIHIIYIPRFKFKAKEKNQVTDARTLSYQPLEMSRLAPAEMEGMLLLNLSQHDAFRFWRRLALLKEEISEMYNRDTEQLSTMKMLFQCWDNENPWMILMDEEGKTITESGRKLVLSCRGSMEDEAKALIELLVKGSKEQRKEALLKSEQLPCRNSWSRVPKSKGRKLC